MTLPLLIVLFVFGALLALLLWSAPKSDIILEREPECGYPKVEAFLSEQGILTYRKEYRHKNLYPPHAVESHSSLHVQNPEERSRAIQLLEREIL